MLAHSTVLDTLSSKTSVEMISAAAATVVAAAWVLAFQGISAPVEAHPQAPAVKVDRIISGSSVPKCTQQAWPYYEGSCLWGRGETARGIRTVRIVSVDRVQLPNLVATAAK